MVLKRVTWIAVVLLAIALGAAASCNSGYNPSSPGGGGGGGGARELNSGDIGSPGQFQHRFFTAGTYNYHCVHHGVMTGSVMVNVAAPDTFVNVSIISSTAPFPAATVRPGGLVVWTNNTLMVHTVTSN